MAAKGWAGGSSSASSGASGRPALPPTLGGPTEAGRGGCSLSVQVFYRQKWRDFGPATPEARKNLAPHRPAFPPRRPRMAMQLGPIQNHPATGNSPVSELNPPNTRSIDHA